MPFVIGASLIAGLAWGRVSDPREVFKQAFIKDHAAVVAPVVPAEHHRHLKDLKSYIETQA